MLKKILGWLGTALLGLLLVVLQMFLPQFHFMHARPILLPILVSYSALRFDLAKALAVAAVLGLLLDLPSITRMGTSSIGFIVLTFFIFSQTENFKFDFLPHSLLLTLLGIFLYLILDYLFFCMQVQTWRWPFYVWVIITHQAIFATAVALPVYLFFDPIRQWFVSKKIDQNRNPLR